jgi:hypothetical protein
MGSLAASIRARDGRTRTSPDEHGRTGEGVWHFAKPSPSSFILPYSSFFMLSFRRAVAILALGPPERRPLSAAPRFS